jgi:ribonuclease D
MTESIFKDLFALREDLAEEKDLNPDTLMELSIIFAISNKKPESEEQIMKVLQSIGVNES